MGMRISGGYGGSWGNYQGSSAINSHQQRQQRVNNLFSALQSGDLSAAQTAFTSLQNNGLSAHSPLHGIGQALQAGNLTAAQQAAQNVIANRSGRNDGDADDSASTNASASSNATTTASGSVATDPNASSDGTASTDPMAAFAAFMQNLEASLEQQNSSTAANTTTPSSTTTAQPSSQAVLWSQSTGFNTNTSAATLKSDLDSLIQQMQASASSSTIATQTSSAGPSTTASTVATPNTADALQSSFTNLISSLGGQGSGASVMNFLQGLDSSLSAASSSLNVSA